MASRVRLIASLRRRSGRGPQLALSGHVHEWQAFAERVGRTWALNPGFRDRGSRPAYNVIDLCRGVAFHYAADGECEGLGFGNSAEASCTKNYVGNYGFWCGGCGFLLTVALIGREAGQFRKSLNKKPSRAVGGL